MRVDNGIQIVLAAALLAQWGCAAGARAAGVRLCGRILSDVMSRVCRTYNSPAWDDPSVDRPGPPARRKRDIGIADQCCNNGCTWEQLNEFCAVSTNSDSSLDALEAHLIADRSAEVRSPRAPTVVSAEGAGGADGAAGVLGWNAADRRVRSEVGGGRSGGYGRPRGGGGGRAHARARGRRCWCTGRRKRRTGRRRASPMGNMRFVSNAPRAAPVVGTVSPLLSWGRTLHAELPPRDRDRFAYIAV